MYQIEKQHSSTAEQILKRGEKTWGKSSGSVFFVGGESGSGKTHTALALSNVLKEKYGLSALVLHQDDYFFLPPKTNHAQRLKNPEQVGPKEVNLALLQQHIFEFKSGADAITTPISDALTEQIRQETKNLTSTDILIIEGTYVLMLEGSALNVFMSRNFRETHELRKKRNRDIMDAFVEQVLEKEHHIISPLRAKAHLVIGKDYNVEN